MLRSVSHRWPGATPLLW